MPKNSRKPTLLFVHGLRGDHHGLRHIYELLESNFEIIAPDLPGYGNNPEPKQPSLDNYLDWLHNFTQKLDQKPILIGHSMGSILISHYAAKYPNDNDAKIILLSPIFRSPIKSLADRGVYVLLRIALFPFPRKLRYKILASHKVSWIISHFLTFDKSQQDFIDQEHLKYSECFASSKSLLSDIKISMTQNTVIPAQKTPFIIIGAKDQLTSPRRAAKIAKKQQLYCKILSKTGHLMNYEKPQALAKLISKIAKS